MAKGRPKKSRDLINPFEQQNDPYDRILEPEDHKSLEEEILNEIREEKIFDEPENFPPISISSQEVAAVHTEADYFNIVTAPKDGTRILVTDGIDEMKAFCRLTRKFFNFRWTPSPAWFDATTNMKLNFKPTHWKHV